MAEGKERRIWSHRQIVKKNHDEKKLFEKKVCLSEKQ